MPQVELILEAKKKTLADVPLSQVHQAQQGALMRLQLWLIGETHRVLAEFSSKASARLIRAAGANGQLGALGLFKAQQAILDDWDKTYMQIWLPIFQVARREAASIPFGTLAIYHDKYLKPKAKKLEAIGAKSGPVFDPQLQAVIDAATQRIYDDGLNLSSRIWKLDRASRDGINQVIMAGVSEQKSAWNIAKDLEQYLGANMDCPRWTSTRLFKLTKAAIASGDRRGLKTGADCKGQGVAYNALRLARTELQAVHAIATDTIMDAQPWVQQEQVELSPAHPQEDICDDAAKAGPQPKGTYVLPLHPNCSPPGQIVRTIKGKVAVENVKTGDLVLTHLNRFRLVTNTMSRFYKGNLVRIKTKSGKELLLTPDHPVLINDAWRKASEIKAGDHVSSI